jgi:hypothetical protein
MTFQKNKSVQDRKQCMDKKLLDFHGKNFSEKLAFRQSKTKKTKKDSMSKARCAKDIES